MTPTNKEWEKVTEENRYMVEARQIAEKVRVGCHRNFNGGHHEKETNEAFHHGMDTVCNGMADTIASALTSQAQELNEKHEADIKALREAIKGNVTNQLGARTACLDAFDHTLSQLASKEAGK